MLPNILLLNLILFVHFLLLNRNLISTACDVLTYLLVLFQVISPLPPSVVQGLIRN